MQRLKNLNDNAWQRLAELDEEHENDEDSGPLEVESAERGSVRRDSAEGPSLL